MSDLNLSSVSGKAVLAATFSRGAYDSKTPFVPPAGFEPLRVVLENPQSPDFAASAYVNPRTGELVVAYRGSDSTADLSAALKGAANGTWSGQFTDAAALMKQAQALAADAVGKYAAQENITDSPQITTLTTGHSLGGMLAQVVAKMYGVEAQVQDAPGAARLIDTPQFKQTAVDNGQPESGHDITGKVQNVTTSNIAKLGEQFQETQVVAIPALGQMGGLDTLATVGAFLANPAAGLATGEALLTVAEHSSVKIEDALHMLAGIKSQVADAGVLSLQPMYFDRDGKPVAYAPANQGDSSNNPSQIQALVDKSGKVVAFFDREVVDGEMQPVAVVVDSGNRIHLKHAQDGSSPQVIETYISGERRVVSQTELLTSLQDARGTPENTIYSADAVNGMDKASDDAVVPNKANQKTDVLDQITDAFSNADKNASDIKTQYPHTTQIADASSNPNTLTNYLNTEGSNLTPAQQNALASQINGLNLGDSKTLSFLNLPGGGTLIANADGEIVGAINRSANGQISLQSRNSNQAVSVQVFDDGSSLVSTTDAAGVVQHQPTNLTAGLSLAQAALSLQNWSQMNDLGRITASVGLYNSLNAVNQGSLGIALGGAAGGLSLLSAFGGNGSDAQKIYTALSGVDILTSSEAIAGSGVIAESMGGAFLPGVNFAMALQSGDPTAITSSGLSLYGAMTGVAWAPQAALAIAVVSLANAALNSGETRSGGQYGWTGGEIEKLAAPSGHAIADESITPLIAGTVKSINVLLGYLGSQEKLSEFHAGLETSGNGRGGVEAGGHLSSGQTFGESGQGSNYAGTLFESTSARSLGTQEAIFNFVTDLKQATLQAIQAAPDVPSHVHDSLNQLDIEKLSYEDATQLVNLLGGVTDLQRSQDGLSENVNVLAFEVNPLQTHVNQAHTTEGAKAADVTTLVDLDGDGYAQKMQWLNTNQAVLGVDINDDGQLSVGELISQKNLKLIDTNQDGKLDANDPMFAALRLWVDVNADAHVDNTTQTVGGDVYKDLSSLGLSAVTYGEDGVHLMAGDQVMRSSADQTLEASALGVQARVIAGGVLESTQQANGELSHVLYAVNTNQFSGDAAHTHGGDVAGDVSITHVVTNSEAAQGLRTTTHNSVVSQTEQTASAVGEGDARLRDGTRASRVLTGTQANAQTTSASNTTQPSAQSNGASQANVFAQQQAQRAAITANAAAAQIRADQLANRSAVFVPAVSWRLGEMADGVADSGMGVSRIVTQQMIQSAESSLFGMSNPMSGLAGVAVGASATQWPVVVSAQTSRGGAGRSEANGEPTASDVRVDDTATRSTLPAGQGYKLLTDTQPTTSASDAAEANVSVSSRVNIPTHQVQASELNSLLVQSVSTSGASGASVYASLLTSGFTSAAGTSVPTAAVVYGTLTSAPNPLGAGSVATRQTVLVDTGNNAVEPIGYQDPEVVGETAQGREDQAQIFSVSDLLANDSFRYSNGQLGPHDALTLEDVGNAVGGQVVLTAAGDVMFTPTANYSGVASFEYTVSNGHGGVEMGMVHLNLAEVNDVPQAVGESLRAQEDVQYVFSAADLLANEVDVDLPFGDVLQIVRVQGATNGTVALTAGGDVVFTPDVNYFGVASFSYTVQDRAGAQSTASVVLQVGAVNDAPVIAGELLDATEDVGLVIRAADLLANDADVDGPQLRIDSVSAIGHGEVSLTSDGNVRFVPEANYQGLASFSYTVVDGAGGSGEGRVSVYLAGVNDAPVATGETAQGQEDVVQMFSSADLLANEVDADVPYGDVLQLVSVQDAMHGTVALDVSGNVAFTPEANYNGDAGFSYTVQDRAGVQSTAQVSMVLAAVNDTPEVVSEVVASQEDETLVFATSDLLANDSDVDDPPSALHVTEVRGLVGGAVSLDGLGKITFTPQQNFNGAASFAYTVSDAQGASREGRVTVNVAEVNDAPVGVDDTLPDQLEDTNLTIASEALLANDEDADLSTTGTEVLHIGTVQALAGQTHGSVSLNAQGQVVYVPDANYVGEVVFGYTTVDHAGVSTGINHVRLNLQNVNDAPTTQTDQATTQEDTALVLNPNDWLLNDSDVDTSAAGDTLRFTGILSATGGTAEVQSDGTVLFTPTPDFYGEAVVNYGVTDDKGGNSSGTVQVSVTNVNDAPLTVGESLFVDEDVVPHIAVATLLANDGDIDNPHTDLRIQSVANATNGSVSLVGNEVVFTPTLNYNGDASFSYTVSDGAGGTSVATTTLHVAAVNDAPTAVGESFSGVEDEVLTFSAAALLANDSDVDSPQASLSIQSVRSGTGGSVYMSGDDVVFTPELNFNGYASFSYMVSDGQGGMSQAYVDVNLASVNDAPVVNSESFGAKANQILSFSPSQLLANDTDAETPNGLHIATVQNAVNGTVTYNGAAVTFTPNSGAVSGSFQYTVSDPDGLQATGTTSLSFTNPNTNPVVVDDTFSGFEDVPLVISQNQLLLNDTDDSGRSNLRVTAVSSATHGSATLDASGTVTFSPSANYYGAASFSYQVTDAEGGSTWGFASLNLASVNDAPIIEDVWLGYPVGDSGTKYLNGLARPASVETRDGVNANGTPVDDPYRQSAYVVAYDPDGNSSNITMSIVSAPAHGYLVVNQYVSYSAPAGIRDAALGSYLINYKNAVQYASDSTDAYSGADPFTIRLTDEGGASVDRVLTPQHVGTPQGVAPVAIDLNGDGVQLVAANDSNVRVDLQGNGGSQKLGWVAPEDGVLVYDENENGLIDQLKEVSFISYVPGAQTDLEGLAGLDTNQDGEISAQDANINRFGVFQDKDNNGLQDPGELMSLGEVGITAISLKRTDAFQVDQGNVVYGTSTVTHADGSTSEAADVWLAVEVSPPGVDASALATSMAEGARAEVIRQATLFNQVCNTASSDNAPALACVPIQMDLSIHEDPRLLLQAA